jgi:2-keto-4-pentenoate hydratase/2-oxohepta-3-ene-1,7-dioic acid hydratase in catechol pathway
MSLAMPRYCRFTVLGKHRWGLVTEEGLQPVDQSPYEGGSPTPTGEVLPLEAVKLEVPATPTKIIGIGRNYAEHAKELGNAVPEEPLVFLKPPSSLLPHGGDIRYPAHMSALVHHEAELGVVIGRTCRDLSEADAAQAILGYTLINDVTARDLQRKDVQFTRAKGFDTFCPVGPWVDTDFVPSAQRISLTVNGETRQDGHLDQMIFKVPALVAYLSRIMTLERGDLIATGTPSGVGPLVPGDIVSVTIEGLGTLTNGVR